MRNFRKTFVMVLALLFMVACGAKATPESSLKLGMETLKSYNIENVEKYFTGDILDDSILAEEDLADENPEMARLLFKNLSYEVLESKIEGDQAVLTTNITNINLGKVFQEYMLKGFEMAFSGIDEDDMDEKMEALLLELLNKEDYELIVTKVDVEMIKVDDVWKIQGNSEFMNGVLGGLISDFDQDWDE